MLSLFPPFMSSHSASKICISGLGKTVDVRFLDWVKMLFLVRVESDQKRTGSGVVFQLLCCGEDHGSQAATFHRKIEINWGLEAFSVFIVATSMGQSRSRLSKFDARST